MTPPQSSHEATNASRETQDAPQQTSVGTLIALCIGVIERGAIQPIHWDLNLSTARQLRGVINQAIDRGQDEQAVIVAELSRSSDSLDRTDEMDAKTRKWFSDLRKSRGTVQEFSVSRVGIRIRGLLLAFNDYEAVRRDLLGLNDDERRDLKKLRPDSISGTFDLVERTYRGLVQQREERRSLVEKATLSLEQLSGPQDFVAVWANLSSESKKNVRNVAKPSTAAELRESVSEDLVALATVPIPEEERAVKKFGSAEEAIEALTEFEWRVEAHRALGEIPVVGDKVFAAKHGQQRAALIDELNLLLRRLVGLGTRPVGGITDKQTIRTVLNRCKRKVQARFYKESPSSDRVIRGDSSKELASVSLPHCTLEALSKGTSTRSWWRTVQSGEIEDSEEFPAILALPKKSG